MEYPSHRNETHYDLIDSTESLLCTITQKISEGPLGDELARTYDDMLDGDVDFMYASGAMNQDLHLRIQFVRQLLRNEFSHV